jgi:predicted transcriptional regulator
MSLSEVNRGVLQHHLHVLELRKRIIKYHTTISTGYFENGCGWSDMDKSMVIHMRNTTTRKILEVVFASTEVTRKDIARILGITGPSVTWHTNRLSKDRILTITRHGRDAYIRLSVEAAETIRRLWPTDSGTVIIELELTQLISTEGSKS